MNRQLATGGWNYGNTEVYGNALHPLPQTTGVALSSLAGLVPKQDIVASLGYLEQEIAVIRTPLTLGWGLLGLASWGRKPGKTDVWIEEALARQEDWGPFDTTAISLLVLAGSPFEPFSGDGDNG